MKKFIESTYDDDTILQILEWRNASCLLMIINSSVVNEGIGYYVPASTSTIFLDEQGIDALIRLLKRVKSNSKKQNRNRSA